MELSWKFYDAMVEVGIELLRCWVLFDTEWGRIRKEAENNKITTDNPNNFYRKK